MWWTKLEVREKAVLVFGGVTIVIAALYLFTWEPFYHRLHALRQTVLEERVSIAWMKKAEIEAQAFRGNLSSDKPVRTGESLLALVDRSARAAGMSASLKRVEPEGKDKVRVWLEDVIFDVLIPWVADLQKSQGVTPESLVVDRQPTLGRVNARLVLAGSSNSQ
ncbi:Type II secretion system protein M [Gammaproteobacteria bacterium]